MCPERSPWDQSYFGESLLTMIGVDIRLSCCSFLLSTSYISSVEIIFLMCDLFFLLTNNYIWIHNLQGGCSQNILCWWVSWLGTLFLKCEISGIGLCNNGLDKRFNNFGWLRICMSIFLDVPGLLWWRWAQGGRSKEIQPVAGVRPREHLIRFDGNKFNIFGWW
jgi:hypothetical protein